MMMRRMAAKDFDPVRYSGKWSEVLVKWEFLEKAKKTRCSRNYNWNWGKGSMSLGRRFGEKRDTARNAANDPSKNATDSVIYDNSSLVSEAKDRSLVQMNKRNNTTSCNSLYDTALALSVELCLDDCRTRTELLNSVNLQKYKLTYISL
ncbi:hypothetical protein VNO78_02158 [Psophocarpus tetragonolobus]|uniref:Uncharacterized protein n=1 Tax=Psophocarpus tetragonolobus TaxID=3891 RepID=A0AAN9XUZ0_PSOTE